MKLATTLNKQRKFDEYLSAMMSVFTSTRWFGIPVYGGKTFLLLTIYIILLLLSIEVVAIWKLIRAVLGFARNINGEHGVTARLSGAIFYGNTLISLLLIWRFLRTWNSLSTYWIRVETKGIYLQPDIKIKKRVIFVTGFVTFFGCVEHGLSMVSASRFDRPPLEWLRRYIMNSHGFMLQSAEYNIWVAIPIFIASIFATTLWNFQDLVIILISMGLASRYHRLNTFVKRFVAYENNYRRKTGTSHLKRVNTWRSLREAYIQQAELVRNVDRKLGCLTVLCNFNNVYFICLQLYLLLRKSNGAVLDDMYYIVSLGWLVFRAISVVLAAAEVNLHSKQALTSLYKCPSYGYNIEIKRLKYYIVNDNICLTGLGMFFMKRGTLLEIAAAIVKYELILLKYDT